MVTAEPKIDQICRRERAGGIEPRASSRYIQRRGAYATLDGESMRILVAEDERKVASFIRQGLEEEGHAVEVAADGETALDLIVDGPPYDLIVLDVMLPKRDGFAVLRALRRHGLSTPVLVLTARDSVADKVTGLDVGADDYLTKPFAFEEFLARVRALLRRGSEAKSPVLRVADLILDPARREVRRGERRITLTAREYALLEYFMRNVGRVLTRPMITEHVWGLDFDPESNVVDVYVGYVRRKIDAEGERPLLRTMRGAGYVLKAGD
jgi:DNA-binding response OmpR family regulator